MKPIPGRRAIFYAKVSAVMHAQEPVGFGVGLAAGILLTAYEAGEMLVLDRGDGAGGAMLRAGVLLLVGVTLIVGTLLFFHRKPRLLRHRLLAALAALVLCACGRGIFVTLITNAVDRG